MLKALLKEQEKLIAEIRAMEERLEKGRSAALIALPAAFGHSDLDSFIRELRQAAGAAPRARRSPAGRKKSSDSVAASSPATATSVKLPNAVSPPANPTPPLETPASRPAPVPAVPEPTGTSLEDPANFGLLPDLSLLERNSQDLAAFQAKLGEALRFTQKVLHTSRVPAKIWREWRQFERAAIDTLRGTHSTP